MLALVVPLAFGLAQRASPSKPAPATANLGATAKVVEAANAFLATLSDAERAKATFEFASAQRTGWSNLPSGIFQRNGLRFGDITARQQAEATRARLAAIVDSSDDAIFSMAMDETILSWNAGAERLYGYLAAEAVLLSNGTARKFLQPDLEPDGFVAMWLGKWRDAALRGEN